MDVHECGTGVSGGRERLRPGFSRVLGWRVFCSCIVQKLPLLVPSLVSQKGCAPVRLLPKRLFKAFLEVFSSQALIFLELAGIYT